MTHPLDTLSKIAKVLYSPQLEYQQLFNACSEYKDLLLAISKTELDLFHLKNDINTPHGTAIGPEGAIRCIDDIMRTRTFCKGVFKAVTDRLKTNDKPVRILYAGTGPFAALVLPLISHFGPDELQFDFLEINPDSVKILKSLIKHFNADRYVNVLCQTDAATYEIPEPGQIDILLSETMQARLDKEPQVAICYHLYNQLGPDTILLPEEIALHLYVVNKRERFRQKNASLNPDASACLDLGPLFVINKYEILKQAQLYENGKPNCEFPAVSIALPNDVYEHFDELMIATKIRVYSEECLNHDESGLTIKLTLTPLNSNKIIYDSVKAHYVTGNTPGLSIELNT